MNFTSGSFPTLPSNITLFTDNIYSSYNSNRIFCVYTIDITGVKKKMPLNP
jgi:hypothetical protein